MENSAVTNLERNKGAAKVQRTMIDILIALAPAVVAAIVFFGLQAAVIIAVCVGTSVLAEFLFNIICKREQTAGDLTAAVTGLLLALTLSTNATIWHCIIGSLFAIVLVKCAFGGLGHNIVNPAVAARVMLLIAFPEGAGSAEGALPNLLDVLLSNRGGAIGEACVAALVLGGIYLLVRQVISWQIPAVYVAGVFLLSFAFTGNVIEATHHILSGCLVLGAVFMATDPVTSPKNGIGKIIFALGCAVMTALISFFGEYSGKGVFFAILLMNILCPYIDKLFEKKQKSEEVAES